MQVNYGELRACPEVMNKDQLRIVCHISKRTTDFLIYSGILPCTITRKKKSRRYKIKRSDVIALVKAAEKNPFILIPPKGWYANSKRPRLKGGMRIYPPRLPTEAKRRSYYNKKFAEGKDVFFVPDIVQITGYDRKFIEKWLRSGKLKSFRNGNKYCVPKTYLIDYLSSEDYLNIRLKSKPHLKDIWAMYDSTEKQHNTGMND